MLKSSTYKSKLLGFTGNVGELAKNQIKVVNEKCTIKKAYKILLNPLINYLVVSKNNIPIGILSKQDIISKSTDISKNNFLAVTNIMEELPVSVQKEDKVLETLIFMIQHNVEEVLVLDKNKPISILTQQDWMAVQVNYPTLLIRNIKNAHSIERLVELRKESKKVIWENFEREGNAVSLTNIITVINDANCKRIIQICLEKMQQTGKGIPPVPFVWIGMGSEGRKAQTVRTDQDNGIIFSNVSGDDYESVKNWFLEFAALVNNSLKVCGFPLCEGNIMASNPMLCDSLDNWTKQFNRIIWKADIKELLEASIYFDFRAVYGKESLVKDLWNELFKLIDKHPLFMKFFAENILQASRPPSNKLEWKLLGHINMELPTLDIKREATAPLDAAIRLLALKYKISETSTLDRLQLILQKGGISKSVADKIHVAFDFILRLRFKLEFSMETEVETLDHTINPNQLLMLEKKNLKDALKAVYRFQDFVYEQITGDKVPWAYK